MFVPVPSPLSLLATLALRGCCAVVAVFCVAQVSLSAVEVEKTIPNHLRQSWPWDPTYFKVDPATADRLTIAEHQGRQRPVQIQRLTRDGESIARAWFIATIDQEEEYEEGSGRRATAIMRDVPVTLRSGSIAPGITLTESSDVYLIDNGVYEFRLRKGQRFAQPIPFSEVPHWSAGARVKGADAWDGRAWFEGTALVREVSVEFIERGPVFFDVAVTYHFVAEEDGTVEALPLEMGKQTYLWEPNALPREEIPKLSHAYTVHLRFIMGHPLIEANERYHLPRDSDAGAFGVHQHWMAWGEPADGPQMPEFGGNMTVDTVTWVRWFLYDQFGGNTTQHFVAAEPRADQRGRPFALLRPRWNQGGGGAQDFVMTSGGPPVASIHNVLHGHRGLLSDRRSQNLVNEMSEEDRQRFSAAIAIAEDEGREDKERYAALIQAGAMIGRDNIHAPAENFSPDNPAVGIFATFASKWVGPYPATIAAYAHESNRGAARFPLIDGERSGMHYGQRSFAIGIGERRRFHHLNDVVRRFTDWTLVAVTNKYITNWQRNPAKAGPNMYITRERLQELREAYRNRDGQTYEIISEDAADLRELLAQREGLDTEVNKLNDARRDRNASAEDRSAAEETWREKRSELQELDRRLGSTDMELLRMITSDWSKQVNPQDANLWLQRRYQDDFLNPTQRAPRNVKSFADADLFANGNPVGGGMHAAFGYISTDLDAWPGWHQGWSPGNPNFHTDKYMGAIYIGGALRDHPHSDEWLAFGWENFLEDVDKVILAPDGVGYECPGYAGYAMGLQLGLARIFLNAGFGNLPAENPLFKKSGVWHRKLITPFDYRIGLRHAAPIGDTHRWTSGMNHAFGALAAFYAESDPEFASEMQGTWHLLLEEGGISVRNRLRTHLIDSDPSIPPMDPADMDWSSDVFHGFGAIMRNRFGSERESFLSVKAGPTRGHYHNDELAYHFYADGHPISLDYNTSYTPRADHAALHNSMTFGNEGTVRHNERDAQVPGMEQIFSTAWPGAFASTEHADVLVAERRSNSVHMTPVFPQDHEFARDYGGREVGRIVHRRYIALIKHDEDSPWRDFMVVRDETISPVPQAVNIHLLASETSVDDRLITGRGQWGIDMSVFVAEASGLEIDDTRSYWYHDDWMMHPGELYTIRPGESIDAWTARMEALKREHGVDSLPLPDYKPRWRPQSGHEDHASWVKLLRDTDGQAMMPPPGWTAQWRYGEYQRWIRLNTEPGTPVLWVLYPHKNVDERPSFEALAGGTGVRLTLGGESQEVYLATDPAEGIAGQAVIRRGGEETVLVAPGTVPALGQIPQQPLPR